jgi:hypothetical protein
LSHLPDVKTILQHWLTRLNKGGILFIDELEGIKTEIPVFRKYLDTNRDLIASQHSDLYIGNRLDAITRDFNRIENRSDIIPVPDFLAARWFYPNTITIWKEDDFIKNRIPDRERISISDQLLQMSDEKVNSSSITWKMKRILITT